MSKVVWSQTVQIPDQGFKTCLVDRKPTVLDANQDLIINEAKNASGILSCRSYNISSVEGIQYFEKIKELDFSSNNITSISDFAPSDSLTRIRINDNELSALPSLNALPQLRTLEVKRNNLETIPDLSSNILLNQLYVEGNQLTTIPNLNSLNNLQAVNVADNNLSSFPVMNGLTNLIEIKAQNNNLTSFPSLENLTVIKEVFLSGNKLSALPKVAVGNQIFTIDIRDNKFSSLPDFTVFPELKRAFLDNNSLTFQDVMPLTNIVGYDTIFPLKKQQILIVGKDYKVRKNDLVTLSTGVDTSVPDVTYSWTYNGNVVQESKEDQLKAKTDTTTDAGYYFAELTHPAFTELTLQTDSFYVDVLACFNAEDMNIEAMPHTCKNSGGQIVVSSANPLPDGFEYQLIANRTSQEFYSEDGFFINLGETEYVLYGAVDNCRELIEQRIEVEQEDCNNAYITVDDDGVNEVYHMEMEGRAQIKDKFGNTVSEMNLPNQWDGRSNGQKVAPGLYYININDGEKVVKITVVY